MPNFNDGYPPDPEPQQAKSEPAKDTISPETRRRMAEAVVSVKAQFEEQKRKHRDEHLAKADTAFEQAERQRKKEWCREWWKDQFIPLPNVYENFDETDFLRVSLPYEGRAESLCDAGLIGEGLKVWLYRRGRKAPLTDVQEWLARRIPTTGNCSILGQRRNRDEERPVYATGLSAELQAVLVNTYAVSVDDGVVRCGDHGMDPRYYPADQW